ncbi:TPA: hypothetical protein DDW35_03445, partial [Candidatus Sumerlaeota bacterium]|nr:hypothetical protein [Candidatus Sumerlaeota bacterium]
MTDVYQPSSTDNDLFPVVNERDEVIGSAPRREVHLKKMRHRAVHVVVFNSRGEILLQRRSATKDSYPGWWDISMGGHVDAGEEYEDAVRRELKEELGIEASVKEIGRREASAESGWEFIRVYECQCDGPFSFPEDEISELRWIPREQLMVEAPRLAPSGRRSLLLWAGADYADVVMVKTSPEEIVQGAWYRMPLLGVGYLAAYLRENGAISTIVDAMFDQLSLEETVQRIVAYSPQIIGF